MAHTPLAESRAKDPRGRQDRSAKDIPFHENAVDAAGIRAELGARMAATMWHRGDGDRTAAIRDLIDRIGEILSGEPDPLAGSDAAAPPDAGLPVELATPARDALPNSSHSYGADATAADAWLDGPAGGSGWPADHDDASLDFPLTDTRYGPAAFATGRVDTDDVPESGAEGLAEWDFASDPFTGDSGPVELATESIDDIVPPDHSLFGYDAGVNGTDEMTPNAESPADDPAVIDMVGPVVRDDVSSDFTAGEIPGEAGLNYARPVLAGPHAAWEPVEDSAISDMIEPAASGDIIADGTGGGICGETGAELESESVAIGPPAADSGDVAARMDSGAGDLIDSVPPQPGTGRTLASGWTVTLTSGTVEADDGLSLILSGNAAGIIILPDGSEIRFDRMTRIDYGPWRD